MFKKILLAIKLGEEAIEARQIAINLLSGTNAHLYVLYVYDSDEEMAREGLLLPSDKLEAKEEEELKKEVGIKLEEYCQPIKDAKLSYEMQMRDGNAKKEILKVAEELDIELIIIGSHSKRNIFEVLLGTTAEYVSKNAKCSVLLAIPKQKNS